jgi:hypothetical protein
MKPKWAWPKKLQQTHSWPPVWTLELTPYTGLTKAEMPNTHQWREIQLNFHSPTICKIAGESGTVWCLLRGKNEKPLSSLHSPPLFRRCKRRIATGTAGATLTRDGDRIGRRREGFIGFVPVPSPMLLRVMVRSALSLL